MIEERRKKMNKIVIVEDNLKRGLSLARQFAEFSNEHPEYDTEVECVCYYSNDSEKAKADIQKEKTVEFNVQVASFLNFRNIMDKYLYSTKHRYFLIIDYMLEDDDQYFEGLAIRRVNIQYARNKGRLRTDQLWFYTATGTANEETLRELVGEKHTLVVTEVSFDHLRLDLRKDAFLQVLKNDYQVAEG